jgi:predicted N-acetyltransferase YhbS
VNRQLIVLDLLFIDDLRNHRYLIPEIAHWQFDAWGPLTGAQTYEGYTELLETAAAYRDLPSSLVALLGGVFVGSVNLVACDMPLRRSLTPWLAQLFVLPSFRCRGVGRRLVQAAQDRAKALGYTRLYLFTSGSLPGYYEQLGWVVHERVKYFGQTRTVMYVNL